MQQYSVYLPVIIQGTIGVLTLLVSGLFYFNYSREKAKNQATKEDIKEITREVESAKKEFIDKTEQFINIIKSNYIHIIRKYIHGLTLYLQ